MPTIRSVRDCTPKFGKRVFLADTAVVVGDVVVGDDCSIWWHAVVRGDVNAIRIGDKVNIQDGAVIHCTYEKTRTIIGDRVSIGHNAIVHGCRIEDRVLIGMGAIVMDDAHVPSNVIVAAGALITEGKQLESGWIYAGVPAKKFKPLNAENADFLIHRTAHNYIKYARWFDEQ